MANGSDPVTSILKILLGDVPARGAVKLISIGILLAAAYFMAKDAIKDFRTEVRTEAAAVRGTLAAYIAGNEAWQNASKEERIRLIKKADRRIARLYTVQGWDYEPMLEEVK